MLLAAAVHVDTQLTYQGQCRWLLRRLRQTLWLSTREINGQSQKRIVGGWEEKGNNKKNSLRALKWEFEKKKKKSEILMEIAECRPIKVLWQTRVT